MRKILILTLALFSFGGIAQANQCPIIQRHDRYNLDQRFFTIGSDFNILSGNQSNGKVVQRIFNWGKTFDLLNENNQLVARARQRVISLGVKVDVYDCNNQMIGSLQENILQSLFKIHTVYSVLDGRGQLMGQSKKLDWFGTDITFYNSSEQAIATLSRPFINVMTDKWVLNINGGNQIDSRILFFAAAYKTSADSDRRSESNDSSKK